MSLVVERPEEPRQALARAHRIQYLWIGITLITVTLMALVMGNSQAMRTAWMEDMLSLLPPIAFLIGARIAQREATRRYPFGYHRSLGIAHLVSGVALLAVGCFLVYEGVSGLVNAERPPIGIVSIFGRPVWLGWLMITVSLASCVAPVILGRIKTKLAEQLEDKVLLADADMNRADWLTGVATSAGVMGIGLGWWWADAVAALIISVTIVKDGWDNVKNAISDLIDTRATTVDNSEPHPLIAEVNAAIREDHLVTGVQTRARDQGNVLHVESFVQIGGDTVPVAWLDALHERIRAMDWRVHDVVITITTKPHPSADPALPDN